MPKKVAVIIINWNSFAVTANCIHSLQQMPYSDYDIIVVDNASTDDSGAFLKETFPQIILIEPKENLGFSDGSNRGLMYAFGHGYKYQLLLNNDTLVQNNFLELLVSYMEAHPEVGAVQPLIYCNHNRSLVWNGGSYFNSWLGLPYTRNYRQPLQAASSKIRQVDWISGCAFLTKTPVLTETDILAPNMFMYYEDIDLSFRIKKAGFRLHYYPQSVIYHIGGMSAKTKVKEKEGFVKPLVHYLNIRNRIWLLKKYTPLLKAPTVIIYNGLYILALMAYFVCRFRFAKLKAVIKGLKDGLTGHIIYQG